MLVVGEAAQEEIDDAIAWYNAQSPGLGEAFFDELCHGFERVGQFPQAWHPMGEGLRRYSLARFPYGIIYRPFDHEVLVVAVAHVRRRPRYWQRA